jgi:haloalkane dehalogenase
MGGVEVSTQAAAFWQNDWQGESFMAVGDADPDIRRESMALVGIHPPSLSISAL